MAKSSATEGFLQDPLDFLDREASAGIVRTGDDEWCLADPLAARSVLLNRGQLYDDHSDFFNTRHGLFGPRDAQLQIRRESRALLRNFLDVQGRAGLASFVDAQLPTVSDWPDTGNRLVYRYLLPVLLAPDSPPALRRLLDDIVERAALANARARQPIWRRMLLQFRTTWLLSGAIESRQATRRAQPLDLLDVVARAAGPDKGMAELADVFLAFVFSIAGSLGFVLGWSIYLSQTHAARDVPREWVALEALRLWPVAWLLERRLAQAVPVAGVEMERGAKISACPYMVHRNPDYWTQSTEFRPERWADPAAWRNPAYMPFGYGPHRCVAADLSTRLVGMILEILEQTNVLSVTSSHGRPAIGPALAPPPFRLTLQKR